MQERLLLRLDHARAAAALAVAVSALLPMVDVWTDTRQRSTEDAPYFTTRVSFADFARARGGRVNLLFLAGPACAAAGVLAPRRSGRLHVVLAASALAISLIEIFALAHPGGRHSWVVMVSPAHGVVASIAGAIWLALAILVSRVRWRSPARPSQS
jgi:hypothetical protein